MQLKRTQSLHQIARGFHSIKTTTKNPCSRLSGHMTGESLVQGLSFFGSGVHLSCNFLGLGDFGYIVQIFPLPHLAFSRRAMGEQDILILPKKRVFLSWPPQFICIHFYLIKRTVFFHSQIVSSIQKIGAIDNQRNQEVECRHINMNLERAILMALSYIILIW